MTVSLLTETGKFNISGAVVARPAGSAGQAAPGAPPVRRTQHETVGGARGNGRGARPGRGPAGLRGHAPVAPRDRPGLWGHVAGGGGCGRGRPKRIGGEAAGRIWSGPMTGAGWPDQTHGRGASMAPMGSSPIRGAALALASHHGRAHSGRVECIVGTTHVEEEEEQHWVVVVGEEEE
ncbi:hypothetical protein VPH35_111791 [Triticum aestivum]